MITDKIEAIHSSLSKILHFIRDSKRVADKKRITYVLTKDKLDAIERICDAIGTELNTIACSYGNLEMEIAEFEEDEKE